MKFVWDFFEVSVNLYQGVIMAYFLYACLGTIREKSFSKSGGMLFGVILAAIITFLDFHTIFEHFLALLYILVLFGYAMLSLRGNILKKTFAAIYAVLLILIPSALVTNYAALLFRTSTYALFSDQNTKRFLTVCAVQLVILYLVFLSLRILRTSKNTDNTLAVREWICISVVLSISILMGGFLELVSMKSLSEIGRQYLAFALSGLVAINVIVCYLMLDLGRKNKAVRENEILRLENAYHKQYVANADAEYALVRKIRHDCKNHDAALYALLQEGKVDAAIRQLTQNMEELKKSEIWVRTQSDIVNAVVNMKLSVAKSYGIDVTCMSASNFSDIAEIDLCRLLSNMLDNALTACRQSEQGLKQILLKISNDERKYIFCVKNTVDASVLEQNPHLITTKDNGELHGDGIRILRDIAKKYHGQCDFYEEEHLFCCMVTLRKPHKNTDS